MLLTIRMNLPLLSSLTALHGTVRSYVLVLEPIVSCMLSPASTSGLSIWNFRILEPELSDGSGPILMSVALKSE